MSTNPLASVMIFVPAEVGGDVQAQQFRDRDWHVSGHGKVYLIQARVNGCWHTCGHNAGVAAFNTAAKRDKMLAELRSSLGMGELVPQLGGPADRTDPAEIARRVGVVKRFVKTSPRGTGHVH